MNQVCLISMNEFAIPFHFLYCLNTFENGTNQNE